MREQDWRVEEMKQVMISPEESREFTASRFNITQYIKYLQQTFHGVVSIGWQELSPPEFQFDVSDVPLWNQNASYF